MEAKLIFLSKDLSRLESCVSIVGGLRIVDVDTTSNDGWMWVTFECLFPEALFYLGLRYKEFI